MATTTTSTPPPPPPPPPTKTSDELLPLPFPSQLIGKRLLLATESFGPVNGVSRTTLNLVTYLRQNGVIVAVVAPEISTGSDNSLTVSTTGPQNNEIEVRLKGYPLPYNPELSVVYPVRLSALYRRTFGQEPDLIYLASPASLGFQILLQLRQQQKPVPVLLNFQTDLSGYCEILFPTPLDAWAVWVFRSVQGYLFRHASVRTVFYPSLFVRRYLEQAKVPSDKMLNLRRGVNCLQFHPSKRSEEMRKTLAPNGEIILVSVSRLAPEKGFEFLSSVAKELSSRNFPYKLLIVGGNKNPSVIQEIKDYFGPLHSDGTVQFTGQLKGEELAAAYAVGDIFLHCSITETFGLVVLESMASGVPVIARDEGGPSEIVADGKSGYLVPPTDLEGFVEKIVKLGNDEILREEMSRKSRGTAEQATWEKINNSVAWKLAEALSPPTPSLSSQSSSSTSTLTEAREGASPGAQAAAVIPGLSIPIYSWLLMSPELRNFLGALIVDARLVGGLGVIIGVWGGLVVTWICVQFALFMKGRVGRSVAGS